jgi:hypothetical protein
MQVDTAYLREKALYCVALARHCPDLTTSHALEALGVELMEKAAELETTRSLTPKSHDSAINPRRAQGGD